MGLDDNLPDELRDIAERLRDARPTFSESEMDQLKVRTMARTSGRASLRGRLTGGLGIRSRGLVVALAALLLGGTAAGGIAAGGFSNGHSNAAWAQYYPSHRPFRGLRCRGRRIRVGASPSISSAGSSRPTRQCRRITQASRSRRRATSAKVCCRRPSRPVRPHTLVR